MNGKRVVLLILFVILTGTLVFEIRFDRDENKAADTTPSQCISKAVENDSDTLSDVPDIDNDVKKDTDSDLKEEQSEKIKSTTKSVWSQRTQQRKAEQKKDKSSKPDKKGKKAR